MWARLVAGMLMLLAALATRAVLASASIDVELLPSEVCRGRQLIENKPQDIHCVFNRKNRQTQAHAGKLTETGLTIGASEQGFISWEALSQSAVASAVNM